MTSLALSHSGSNATKCQIHTRHERHFSRVLQLAHEFGGVYRREQNAQIANGVFVRGNEHIRAVFSQETNPTRLRVAARLGRIPRQDVPLFWSLLHLQTGSRWTRFAYDGESDSDLILEATIPYVPEWALASDWVSLLFQDFTTLLWDGRLRAITERTGGLGYVVRVAGWA